ncbi:recombinase family protein [Paraglaciecola chathamensis]|uniref:Resolvase family protein n=1 Tax=Paraglaciecola chathamensis S18K6 TaxID=1127672 RepID=A0AAV3V686_9ALTE|nr:recombinase family protein [Paraglaciecola chathamensis]GAC12227.1 resolvase family protein [Paraglaciecola chathamensis S18K6]
MKYVIYLRVSTKEQGKSGLGLEAQRRDIQLYLDNYSPSPYSVIDECLEVDSGANSQRIKLVDAINLAKKHDAVLLVAKLDRLSRKVSFIAKLMEDKKLNFKVATMPHADPFQLHIYAALAEQEREFISKRTKAALAEAKSRGTRLGGLRTQTNERNIAKRKQADDFAKNLWPMIEPMVETSLGYTEIAKRLNSMNVKTANGGAFWASTVSNIVKRMM